MGTYAVSKIEEYLNKYGNWTKNKKWALSLGILDANTLKTSELNKKLAQVLYNKQYCVDSSGKLLKRLNAHIQRAL